jgi:hypothetical protein
LASRTCKLDADLKKLWQTLLPGTPFPQCGTPEDASAGDECEPAKGRRDEPLFAPFERRPRQK